MSTTAKINRRAVIERHNVHLTSVDAQNPLTVGNGDFAFTADITGMQAFRDLHDPKLAEEAGRLTVATSTMSSWGWHEMPNPDGFVLDDAMTTYETSRGPVEYPDRFDLDTIFGAEPKPDKRAGTWLHVNPQRLDLGRIGLTLRQTPGSTPETDPEVITNISQSLDLWKGSITSKFTYRGSFVTVTTVAHPERAEVAFRIESELLTQGLLAVKIDFPYASSVFNLATDWDATARHQTSLSSGSNRGTFRRRLDDMEYWVSATWNAGTIAGRDDPHSFELTATSDVLELAVDFALHEDELVRSKTENRVDAARQAAESWWDGFWSNGAAVDFAGSTDPRAPELERRLVLSQYLTAVNCSGTTPPAETGLIANSWQGKFHLEMHWWHAAHFATWGRHHLLDKSFPWYESIVQEAEQTAARQHYDGLRWPKQVGPEGRESPTDIGSLLIWQQPHLLYLLELSYRADPRHELVERYADVVDATARFMASFVEDRNGTFHLPAPLMPAQEFYDAKTTEDPTFELAYWAWGLEIAQRWLDRQGEPRNDSWTKIQANIARPHIEDGVYSAISTAPFTRRDDHPSMLCALGFVPDVGLISHLTMAATVLDVLDNWDWNSAWGWDFSVIAMAATRIGDPSTAVNGLLATAEKNHYLINGHNPQMGNFLPIYLPGNGGLLAAASLMIAGWDGSEEQPGFPRDGTWKIAHEGFIVWPS